MLKMSNVNARVKVTQEGSKYMGLRGTVIAENKFSWLVKIDGAKIKGIWLRKPDMPDAGCQLSRGRRPKGN